MQEAEHVHRRCSRLTALWRYINFVLVLLLLFTAYEAYRATLRVWPNC